MRFTSSAILSSALALGGCNLVLGIVPLSGEDRGGGSAEGGGALGGGASGGGGDPSGGSNPGGGGSGGSSPTCESPCAEVEWAVSFGSSSDDDATGLAFGPNGRIAVTGDFGTSGEIGQTPIGEGGYIAPLTAQGVVGTAIPGANTTGPIVTIDAQGNAAVAGSFDGDIMLGATPLSGRGAFFARQAASGAITEADALLAADVASDVKIFSIALAPDGSIALCGGFKGTVDFADAGSRSSTGSNNDAFVMVIPKNGTPWVMSYGAPNNANNAARVISFREDGDVVVGLRKQGVVDFGPESSPAGVGMIFLTLDVATGATLQLSRQFDGGFPSSMVVGADGMIYVGGTTTADCDFGPVSVAADTAFAAMIDPSFQSSDTAVPRVWSLDGLSVASPVLVAPAEDGTSDVLVAGSFAGDLDSPQFGLIPNAGGLDFLLARLDPESADAVYVAPFGGSFDDAISAIAVGPNRAILTGTFASEDLKLADEALPVVGQTDVFVAGLFY